MDDRDTRKLLRLVKNNRSLPLQDITRECNENREDVVSSVTVRRCLYRNNFHRRVVWKNIIAWARGKRYWTVERDWSWIIFSDECKIIVKIIVFSYGENQVKSGYLNVSVQAVKPK